MTALDETSSPWDLDSVRPLAEEFGITDLEALCRELASAYHFATFGLFSAVHGDYSTIPSHFRDLLNTEQFQRRLRLARLHWDMTLELAAQVDDPLHQSANAKGLRKYLARFGAELGWEIFEPPVPGKKRRTRTTRFVVALAPAWERLTGEAPKAWEVDGKVGGRHFKFVCAACKFFKLDPPCVGTMREGYIPRVRREVIG